MKIAVVGTGYVGLVLGACLSENGNTVACVDKDASKHWYRIESESGNRPPGWIPVVAAKRIGDVR